MQDPITDLPPPSRLFPDDINNFAAPHPSLSLAEPSFCWIHGRKLPESPQLLLIAVSKPAAHLFHHLPSKTLVGTLVLPEASSPAPSDASSPSLRDRACYIYELNRNTKDDDRGSILVVNIQYAVAPERATLFARVLLRELRPQKVAIAGAVARGHFRGKISADDTFIFRLETQEQKISEENVCLRDVPYLPSGSLVDGLAAALLIRCQILQIKAVLLVAWPEASASVVKVLSSAFERLCAEADWHLPLNVPFYAGLHAELDLYS